jgi:RHS repeat-associated protein
VNRTGSTDTPFLYNGQYGVMTDENGLYYMRARYYNPDIKRFINLDVLLGSIDSGQSLNRYAYVNGNPVLYTDPEGQFVWNVACGGVGAVLNMGATIAGSLIAGDDVRWQEVAAAGVGGFAGGVAFSLSGNIIAASAAETAGSTAAEVGLNKLSGVEKPASKYAKQAGIGLIADLAGSKAAQKMAGPLAKKAFNLTPINKLSGAAANPKNWIKPTTIRGALTGKMAKRNYIDEAIAFPFVTGGNIANKLLSK